MVVWHTNNDIVPGVHKDTDHDFNTWLLYSSLNAWWHSSYNLIYFLEHTAVEKNRQIHVIIIIISWSITPLDPLYLQMEALVNNYDNYLLLKLLILYYFARVTCIQQFYFWPCRLDDDCSTWRDQWIKYVQCYGRYRDCYAKVKMAWNIFEEFITTLAKNQPGRYISDVPGKREWLQPLISHQGITLKWLETKDDNKLILLTVHCIHTV